MKQHLTEIDLLELSEQQKENLRYIWIPKERDLVVAFISKNAESGEFDQIEFTIGKVEIVEMDYQGIRSMTKKASITLRSLRLVDDNFYDSLERADDIVEDMELDYQTPDDFFSLEYCLPLLNIGQIIEILSNQYFSDYNFFINFNKDMNRYQVGKRMATLDNENFDFESDELCDALWKALKSIL